MKSDLTWATVELVNVAQSLEIAQRKRVINKEFGKNYNLAKGFEDNTSFSTDREIGNSKVDVK